MWTLTRFVYHQKLKVWYSLFKNLENTQKIRYWFNFLYRNRELLSVEVIRKKKIIIHVRWCDVFSKDFFKGLILKNFCSHCGWIIGKNKLLSTFFLDMIHFCSSERKTSRREVTSRISLHINFIFRILELNSRHFVPTF